MRQSLIFTKLGKRTNYLEKVKVLAQSLLLLHAHAVIYIDAIYLHASAILQVFQTGQDRKFLSTERYSPVLQVLQRRIRRISDEAKAAVKSDVEQWLEKVKFEPNLVTNAQKSGQSWETLLSVFPSADVLLDELEASQLKICMILQQKILCNWILYWEAHLQWQCWSLCQSS